MTIRACAGGAQFRKGMLRPVNDGCPPNLFFGSNQDLLGERARHLVGDGFHICVAVDFGSFRCTIAVWIGLIVIGFRAMPAARTTDMIVPLIQVSWESTDCQFTVTTLSAL